MARIPPAFALRALEAAARHHSYSRTAEELSITHGAVSQQIRRLETELGARLFERRGNAMIPTPGAERLAEQLRRGFEVLRDAVADFSGAPERERLVVTLSNQFARRWLPARLPRLLASPAGTNLELLVEDRVSDLLSDGVDVGVRYGAGDWVGLASERLLEETLTPVCTPEVAKRLNLRRARDLLSAPLLHHARVHWSRWFEPLGLKAPASNGTLFKDSVMLVEAAAQGIGVALARSSLIEADLASGRLVAPFDTPVVSEYGYFLAWRPDNRKLPRIHALRDWLVGEVRAAERPRYVAA